MKSIKQIYHKLSLHRWTLIHIYVYTLASLMAQTVKNLPAMLETWVWTPELVRSPGEGNGYPLQYSSLENPMDRLQSMGLQRNGHNWVNFTFTYTYSHTYACVCIYTHTYIYMYIHRYIHTHMLYIYTYIYTDHINITAHLRILCVY